MDPNSTRAALIAIYLLSAMHPVDASYAFGTEKGSIVRVAAAKPLERLAVSKLTTARKLSIGGTEWS
jgi:hypothetical protein